MFCDNSIGATQFVGILTRPNNEPCAKRDRYMFFERVDKFEKFYRSATNQPADKESTEPPPQKKDTTEPDPYGEGVYVTGQSGEYSIPGPPYVKDENFEDIGDGLPVGDSDDEDHLDEGGLNLYFDKDLDGTNIVEPPVEEYQDNEFSKRNITANEEVHYPMQQPAGDPPFYDIKTVKNDPHYGPTEVLAPGVPANYYEFEPVTADIKPWIDFPDDGAGGYILAKNFSP